ncbi:MAG: toxin TcdB middle/C-terminal domain-containing protein, partial [Burkholderiales bacterium]
MKALDEETGPRAVFADGTQSIFLADFSGDGLTDIVRVRNGEVSYWPNLGHGRFGAKVGMDHAPWFDAPDVFDSRRIRLADIDGSGTTDILYLATTGVRIYFNQSGNSWSPACPLAQFPATDSLASAAVVDLLGNGTACLVWSSPLAGDSRRPMRYIDLMGGQKPHLLVAARNNLGAETRVHYAPSTRFYVQDRDAGTPWITRLPFPVHVVERVETLDRISRNRFVTRYRYSHGYFDAVEREFRGFGRVDQWDTEEIGALRPDVTEATNIDAASYVPPVHTRTWFHTGVCLGRAHVSDFFAGLLDLRDRGEYYREPGLTDPQARELLLDDTVLPEGLTVEEEREACRALKGSMLRQEIYALDGPGTVDHPHGHPYNITEQNFSIRRVQPQAGNRHAVFFAHAREALSYQYERNPSDPRIAHQLTLAVDAFGNVLRSAAIGYGRREADGSLLLEDQTRQTQLLATYIDNEFTNPIDLPDAYRVPVPSQTRSYEVTGLPPSDQQARFTLDEVHQATAQAQDIAYEAPPDGSLQRRLIEHVRTLYRRNDL